MTITYTVDAQALYLDRVGRLNGDFNLVATFRYDNQPGTSAVRCTILMGTGRSASCVGARSGSVAQTMRSSTSRTWRSSQRCSGRQPALTSRSR